MSGHILAMGGGDIVSPTSKLDDYLLELSEKQRPRIGFLPTAGGEQPEGIQRFYDAFAGRECEPSHLELFGMPDEPAAWVAAQDVVYVCGGNTANALAIWRVHGVDVALREAWDRGAVLGGWSAGANCWFEDPSPTRTALGCAGSAAGSAFSRLVLPALRRRARAATDVHQAHPQRRAHAGLRGRRRCRVPFRGNRAARGRQPARGSRRLPDHGRRRGAARGASL